MIPSHTLVLLGLIPLAVHAQYRLPSQDGVGVQLFQWPFKDIANECTSFLGPNGYAWVQTSPVQAHVKSSFDAYSAEQPWYITYQPLSYRIGNRLGSYQDFVSMVETCRRSNVDIVVDVVLNHMPYASKSDVGGYNSNTKWDSTPFKETFPDVGYNSSHFHTSRCNGELQTEADFKNDFKVWNCRLVTLADLATENEFVRGNIVNFLNELLSLGVAGFRIDAAKHVPPEDWKAIYSRLNLAYNGRPAFISQEVMDPFTDGSYKSYPQLGSMINFDYARLIGRAFRNLEGLTIDDIPDRLFKLPLSNAVSTVLIENHDKERDKEGDVFFPLSRINQGFWYKMASAFQILYPWGTPIVHSGYAIKFNGGGDQRESPVSAPFDKSSGLILSVGNIVNNICNSAWSCQHRYSDVFALVRVRNWMARGLSVPPRLNSLGQKSNKLYWSVPGKAFVLINAAQNFQPYPDVVLSMQTNLEPGSYCNMVYGRLVGRECVLWPGVVLRNNEQVLYKVDSNGFTTVNVRDADKSRILALYSAPDGYLS